MHWVYILQSIKNRGLYIGCTSNLKERMVTHNKKGSYHTAKHAPWRLIYVEGYFAKRDAYGREQSLKLHAQGLRRVKERLSESILV